MTERLRAKAPKALRTSDVARPRTLAFAALGAGLGVTVAALAGGLPLGSERSLPRPHAKVACASCHESSASAAPVSSARAPGPLIANAVCTHCHGPSHGSKRPAHRALVAKGELGCTTCHAQHTGAQGVTFEGDKVVRWGAGAEQTLAPRTRSGVAAGSIAKGTTVPLVPLTVCARCHDTTRASDPISACVSRGAVTSQCFDEHTGLGVDRTAGGDRAACSSQHGTTRFVAWEAARDIAATSSWVAPSRRESVPWAPAAAGLIGALVLGAAHSTIERRRRRRETSSATGAAPRVAPPERKRLPTINTSTCLGCYACVDACPFDVLTIEKYVAVVARPEECCGVVLCEQVCPNGSLKVSEGEPLLDRPATDEELESRDVPGVFIAGDLTGLPLIKNAINQGTRAIDRIASTLPKRRVDGVDVIVIGAGPAGLSAALRAKEKGLSCVVLEQATVAASIKSFPRDKIVHDPPLELPIEGELWLKQATKEELLAQWTRIVRTRALDVREGHRVVELTKHGTGFVVRAEREGGEGAAFEASRVVVAIGRRGTPRTIDLAIDPGLDDRVAYALADARSFEGKNVIVVGLGDSAMEAAIALARQPGTSVIVSYRGSRFARGKAKNIAELTTLIRQNRVKVLFETVPTRVTKAGVTLEGTGPHAGRRNVPADAVLVLIGGVPSWDLLVRAGIRRPVSPGDPAPLST